MGNGTENDPSPVPDPHRKPSTDELRKRFCFHAPRDDDAIARHEMVRQLCFTLSVQLTKIIYPGRHLSLTLTALEEVSMRANASIACDDPRD